MKTKLNRTFIIVNKESQEKWEADSGKSSWKATNHAKCAFANSGGNAGDTLLTKFTDRLGRYDSLKFNDQDVYEIVELKSEDALLLDKIKGVVALCEDWCGDQGIGLTESQVCMSAMKDIRRMLK